jgi:hypothetical protein
VLRDLAGQPLTGTVDVHFAIYKDATDTAAIWEETQTLQLDEHGRYAVLLGATQPEGLPLLLFESTEAQWLGVSGGKLPEQPRVLLVSVPYALKASDADTLGGKPASAYVTTDAASNSSGQSQKPGTTSVQGQVATVGHRAEDAASNPSPTVTGTGTMNFLPIWTNSTTLGNSLLFQTGGNVGVATVTPGARLDAGGTGIGIRGTSSGVNGTGVLGNATAETGASFGVLGQTASKTNNAAGVLGEANAKTGVVFGVSGVTNSTTNYAVAVNGWEGATTGQVVGVAGGTSSTTNGAAGVSGWEGATAGAVFGVYGGTNSTTNGAAGVGAYEGATTGVVYGVSGGTASTTNGAAGVNGFASAATGSSYGVSGSSASTSGVGVLGTASASGGGVGVEGVTASPNGVGGAFFNTSGSGLVLTGSSGSSSTRVFSVDASGNGTFAGSIAGTSFSGSGAGLTSLSPANLSAGTAAINISGSAATAATAGNALSLGGVAAANYARLDIGNSFTGNQSVSGNVSATGSVSGGTASFSGALTAAGAVLPAAGTAAAAQGFNSNPMDLQASSYNSGTSAAVPQLFRWQAEPKGNDTASPSGTLNLLYLAGGGTPAETGLSIASNGLLTFASGQTFPGTGTVTSVGSGTGLTGGPITSSGTLSVATGGVTNAMLANPALTVTAGTDLTGGGPVALGSSVTLNLDTSKVPTLGAASNTFTGSLTASGFNGSSGTFSGSTSPVVSGTNTGTGSFGQLAATVNSAGDTGVYGSGSSYGFGVYGINTTGTGDGVYGSGYFGVYGTTASGTGAGVYGTGPTWAVVGLNSSNSSTGQLGTTLFNGPITYATGVYGKGSDYGVYGNGGTYGVYGSGSSYGLYGATTATGGVGVSGNGTSYGVYGTATATSSLGVYGSGDVGVSGSSLTYGSSGALGTSLGGNGTGVYGAGTGFGYGVYGVDGMYGVYGMSGLYGVYGKGPLYGVFCDGPYGSESYQSATVALPDNRVVELYAMQSPENWFEDFGSGQLHDGVAQVALDPTFALAVNTGAGYHVFLTPKGDCEGLYVAQETATAFQVRELRGGKSNIAFDYRIVAKRRGYEDLRMAQLEADAETVQTIREVVQSRPAHRKLILHKPAEAPKAPPALPKVGVPPAPPAVAIPKPPALPKLPAPPTPPKVAAPPAAPAPVTPRPPEPPKTGAAPAVPVVVTPKPAKPVRPPAPSEPPKEVN